jgi:hypothetical protein
MSQPSLLDRLTMSPASDKAAQAAAHRHDICKLIESDAHLVDLLSVAITTATKTIFIRNLLMVAPNAFESCDSEWEPDRTFEMITRWLGRCGTDYQIYPCTNIHIILLVRFRDAYPLNCQAITAALDMRLDAYNQQRQDKRRFIERIGLNWSSDNKAKAIDRITAVYLNRLPKGKEYPPQRKWMYESDAVYAKWEWYVKEKKLPDKREVVRSMFRVDPAELQLDLGPNDSAVIYDRTTRNLVAIVIRNFTMEPELLAHVEDAIKRNLQVRKSVRVSCFY